MPEADHAKMVGYHRAMLRLSDAGRIRLEPFGQKSRGQKEWVEVPK